MSIRRVFASALLCCSFFVHPQLAHAETFNTCAGFIDTVPATISTQGVWCLRHDLATNVTSGAAITIAANNVTIDCNDFKLGGLAAGTSSLTSGIEASSKQNATVRHCNVRGFLRGIVLQGGAGHLVEENRLDNNLTAGILIGGDNGVVRRNRVYDTGGSTGGSEAFGLVSEGYYAVIQDNVIGGAFTAGTTSRVIGIYSLGNGSRISNNQISGLARNGGGDVIGVHAYEFNQIIDGNRILGSRNATPIDGFGIYAAGTTSDFCSDNTIALFTQSMWQCSDDGGNALH